MTSRHLSLPDDVQNTMAEGFRLFELGRFWESHEAWESGWNELARSHQKIFVQSLIQIAACMVLLQDGRTNGFNRKRQQVQQKLAGFEQVDIASIHGIALDTLIQIISELETLTPTWVATQLFRSASFPKKEPSSHA
ncbi:MAG: DUF309 domain-containing protein [Vampirovibrionales bacterium]|nr:DUF309 domain-containing protein [Vampirovibrionales bacterium]